MLISLWILPSSSWARGVGGVGNTGDISIQFEFSRENAIAILRSVSIFDLYEDTQSTALRDLYRSCRDTMFRGAVNTVFELVETIDDGNSYHALARRLGDRIQISRHEMQRLSESGSLSADLLVAVVLHEVGHDCRIQGRPVDDSYDPLLNQLGVALYRTSRKISQGAFKDLEFIAMVEERKPVQLNNLSPRSQELLTQQYLNYVGDWLYLRYQDRFHFRPSAASDFYATERTAIFPGWNLVNQAIVTMNREINAIVFGVLRASFEQKSLAYYDSFNRLPLPTTLNCTKQRNEVENLSFASCALEVYWSSLPVDSLSQKRQRIAFTLNSLSQIAITDINMLGN
jgi:hypothetical protein